MLGVCLYCPVLGPVVIRYQLAVTCCVLQAALPSDLDGLPPIWPLAVDPLDEVDGMAPERVMAVPAEGHSVKFTPSHSKVTPPCYVGTVSGRASLAVLADMPCLLPDAFAEPVVRCPALDLASPSHRLNILTYVNHDHCKYE